MNYLIIIKPSAQKDLDNLPIKELGKIVAKLKLLSKNPRPIGIQKLSNDDGYRIRSGNYRILFLIDDQTSKILIYRIKHRKDVYK
ncbi:MAG: type II toxin-antitoxin system RelE/ParE family toxin [Melioribacteraceae bacterium]